MAKCKGYTWKITLRTTSRLNAILWLICAIEGKTENDVINNLLETIVKEKYPSVVKYVDM